MQTSLYPLRFQPVLKRYLWGGRRLGTVLGKPIGEGDDYAESWELADHAQGQSVVANGPLAGRTLHELVAERGNELFGRHADRHGGRSLQRDSDGRFPLIFKYLDCNRDLSVQVHPDDAAAALLRPPDLGKTEAWVILDVQPGSRVYAGLKAGIDRDTLAREVAAGRTEACLHWLEPRAGDCIFIPAGTVHALGAGLLVAEIQQASDTTWRLYDWGRVGTDGQPRKLHVAEALAAIDYAATDVRPQAPQPTDKPHVQGLVACDKFVLDRWTFSERDALGGDDRFHLVSVMDGELLLGPSPGEALQRGETVLLPASLGSIAVEPRGPSVLLDMYLP